MPDKDHVKCCVRVNGCLIDWFPVDIGVKQGCILSPILFSMYIHDLTLVLEKKNLLTMNEGLFFSMQMTMC